jgi:hypothetical protein
LAPPFALSADFSVDDAVNFIAVEAGIFTGAPVWGLRPVRAARALPLNEPKPGHETLSPPFAAPAHSSKNAPRTLSACAFVTPAVPASRSSSSALVIDATATSDVGSPM